MGNPGQSDRSQRRHKAKKRVVVAATTQSKLDQSFIITRGRPDQVEPTVRASTRVQTDASKLAAQRTADSRRRQQNIAETTKLPGRPAKAPVRGVGWKKRKLLNFQGKRKVDDADVDDDDDDDDDDNCDLLMALERLHQIAERGYKTIGASTSVMQRTAALVPMVERMIKYGLSASAAADSLTYSRKSGSGWRLAAHWKTFVANGFVVVGTKRQPPIPRTYILRDPVIREALKLWVRAHTITRKKVRARANKNQHVEHPSAPPKRNMRAVDFQRHVNSVYFNVKSDNDGDYDGGDDDGKDNEDEDDDKGGISLRTAYRWLHSLGFSYRAPTKSYIDGHEDKDVVAYRKAFTQRMLHYRQYMTTYSPEGESQEWRVKPPSRLLHGREVVRVDQDEVSYHSFDTESRAWLESNIASRDAALGVIISSVIEKKWSCLKIYYIASFFDFEIFLGRCV